MRTTGFLQARAARLAIAALLLCMSGRAANAANQQLTQNHYRWSGTAPSIAVEPVSRTVTAPQRATFSVAANGTPPLTFQWRMNGTAISGATSSSYTTPVTTTSQSGEEFSVVVKNSAGRATSNAAVLTVNAAASVLDSSATSMAFGSVDLSNSNTKSVTLTNAGSSSVTISNVQLAGAGFGASGVSSGLILSSGQSAALSATFDPAASGSATGSITITSNAANSPMVIVLSGTGVAPTTYSVSLSWTASTSSVTGYNVYSSTVSGGPYTKLTSTPVAATNYTDSGVQQGTTYYFVVTSVNSENQESAYSGQASANIP
jgi:Abnormal spindle-like microcephaly-assoc'd, ASPM-SPD-2-Hydin/Fibronectin type III domain